jgi:superfamily II DNA helicase RecQ
MSRSRPATAAEFLDITGVGQVKLDRYGQIFMQALAGLSTGVGSLDPTPVDNSVDN